MTTRLASIHGRRRAGRPARACRGHQAVANLLARPLGTAVLLLAAVVAQAGVVFTNLHSFTGGNDGFSPNELVQGRDGYLYGTTTWGGAYGRSYGGYGVVFRISTEGAFTALHQFTGLSANDGGQPDAGLVQGGDGYLYGATFGGFNPGYGTLFRISTNGALTHLFAFTGGDDGAAPETTLVQGSDGYFYGTTSGGGAFGFADNGYGTVFKLSTNGTLTGLNSFTGGSDDAFPLGKLLQGNDGYFYGTTTAGGDYDNGTVFSISADGVVFNSLYSFTGGDDGTTPYAGLVQASDGYFYGVTDGGGIYSNGTVFKISASGALTTLYSFTGTNDGANPDAALVQGTDGYFYGTSFGGGTYGNGTVFKITGDGVLTSLYSFTGTNDGAEPEAGLVQGGDGYFYGTTSRGGADRYGTVFRLTTRPLFEAMTLSNGAITLTWSADVGSSYQLQYTADLASSNWTDLGSILTASGATLSAIDSVTNASRRFYRVALLP